MNSSIETSLSKLQLNYKASCTVIVPVPASNILNVVTSLS